MHPTTIKPSRLLAALAFLALTPTQAQADDAPAGVTLRAFVYAGSGCAADSTTGSLPVDGNAFDIEWQDFTAAVGDGVPVREKRKNCQVNLDLDVPDGWQYAVESIDYSGAVKIESDVQAIAGSAYYFQGDAATVRFNTLFDGPEDRAFLIRDIVPDSAKLWSPCGGGRSLNINFQVRLDNSADSTAAGRIDFGDADGVARTHLELDWRPCQ